ncbi:MAG: glycosyltransferase family 2 protein [Lachnospiraceae bacterium]|nr:glycosyltransferase family 2 protein [Lachnospiraceae bacterium]
MKLITVCTPTYNRVKLLKRCYESLLTQTSQNFIWQIIDDGSTDNTEKEVEHFISEGRIEIQYVKKPNGGKMSALNLSMEITGTELWVCLDSDDYFLPDAISVYEKYYPLIKEQEEICGLFSVRSNPEREPMMGKGLPEGLLYETQFNIRYKYKVNPEYVQVYKTNVLKEYKYPIIENEKYIPLSYTQDLMDQKYRFMLFREPTMVCEYHSDGITKSHAKLIKKNPKGYTEFKKNQIIIAPGILFKIKACIAYDTGCILSHDWSKIYKSPSSLLTVLCFPFGWLNYFVRYRKA